MQEFTNFVYKFSDNNVVKFS